MFLADKFYVKCSVLMWLHPANNAAVNLVCFNTMLPTFLVYMSRKAKIAPLLARCAARRGVGVR